MSPYYFCAFRSLSGLRNHIQVVLCVILAIYTKVILSYHDLSVIVG